MKASLLYYLLKIKRKKSIKFVRDVASKIDTNHVNFHRNIREINNLETLPNVCSYLHRYYLRITQLS